MYRQKLSLRGKPGILRIYDSFVEMADRARNMLCPPENDWIEEYHGNPNGFAGRAFRDWGECAKAATTAWDKGIELTENLRRRIEERPLPTPVDRRRRTRWMDDDGDEICADRLRTGGKFWRASPREFRQGPSTICVFSNIATTWSTEWRKILFRAAAAAVLADILEARGYRVEFWATSFASQLYRDGTHAIDAVCLKQARQPLDIATIVSATAGWSYRTIWFKSFCLEDKTAQRTLGQPHALQGDEMELICGRNAARVSASGFYDETGSLEFIRETLEMFR